MKDCTTQTCDINCVKVEQCDCDPDLGHLLASVIGWVLVTSGYSLGSPGLLLISLAFAMMSFLACSLLNSSGLSGISISGSFKISWSLASSSWKQMKVRFIPLKLLMVSSIKKQSGTFTFSWSLLLIQNIIKTKFCDIQDWVHFQRYVWRPWILTRPWILWLTVYGFFYVSVHEHPPIKYYNTEKFMLFSE